MKRVVLGVGHPWFSKTDKTGPDYVLVYLCDKDGYNAKPLPLKFGTLGAYNRIRLVAEIIPPPKRRGKKGAK